MPPPATGLQIPARSASVARRCRSTWRRFTDDEEGAAGVVQLVLIAPLLALLMVLLLHLGLFLMTRQAVITAVAEGLKDATVYGADPASAGPARAREILDDYSAATGVQVATSVDDLAGTVTMTVSAQAPGVAPALPRTIEITQTATHERWLP